VNALLVTPKLLLLTAVLVIYKLAQSPIIYLLINVDICYNYIYIT